MIYIQTQRTYQQSIKEVMHWINEIKQNPANIIAISCHNESRLITIL